MLIIVFYVFFRFDVKIAAAVAEETNLPFVTAENKFEALVMTIKLYMCFLN